MTIKITWKRAFAAVVGLAAFGFLFALSGLFNVAASSGHWAITDWGLHWVMRNSVRTHAAFSAPEPVLDASAMVSAAGHFDQACAACHGAPGIAPLPVMQRATPPAPDLAKNAPAWRDRQLYWIIEHGVKFTGMPAWSAKDRPDEIRRMTAFVRRLPTMSPKEYAMLTGRDAGTAGSCAGCHGADGRGRGQGDIPILAGQRAAALARALRDYRAGTRDSAVMATAAARLNDADIDALAARYAATPGLGGPRGRADKGAAARIAAQGLPKRQLPACTSCHGPQGRAPLLSGQRATYLAQRLRGWQVEKDAVEADQDRSTMAVIARRIPKEMIDPLARELAGGD